MSLELLRKHKLYAKLIRCDFYEDKIHYLGHIISDKGISIDHEKIEVVMSWPSPRKMTDVRYFVRLAEYCRGFTKGCSTGKVEPMYRLRRHVC